MLKKLNPFIYLILLYCLCSTTMATEQTIDEQRTACTGAGFEWDSSLNACMQTQQAVELKEDHDTCAESEDPDSCYKETAESFTGVKAGDGTDGKLKGAALAKTAAGAYSLFSMVGLQAKLSGATPTGVNNCMSKKIFMGTSVAWILGDIFLKMSAKDKFKKLQEQYKDEATNEDQKGGVSGSYQAQVRAFTYLKQEQEHVKEQADGRSKLQLAVVLGYGASMGMAIYETFMMSNPATAAKACYGGSGQVTDMSVGAQIGQNGSSPQIGAASGVMFGASIMLAKEAKKQKNKADENIKAIDEALETFAGQMAGYCPDGREDLSNDRCYCYGDDGTKNESRTNSAMCQNLWAADVKNFSLDDTNYALNTGPAQVCLRVDGKVDEDCKCKKLIDSKTKQNACSTNPYALTSLGSFGTAVNASGAVAALDNFSQGTNQALANLNSASLTKSVAKTKKGLSALLKQAEKKGINLGSLESMAERAQAISLKAATPQAIANYGGGSGFGLSSRPSGISGAVNAAKVKVEESLKQDPALVLKGSKKGSSKKKANFKFKWNENAARDGNQVKHFNTAQVNKHINNSDIIKKKDKNIFKIISRRYQVSGMRYLFDDE
jgi:hypothetical protein